jgi:hypothetical protein
MACDCSSNQPFVADLHTLNLLADVVRSQRPFDIDIADGPGNVAVTSLDGRPALIIDIQKNREVSQHSVLAYASLGTVYALQVKVEQSEEQGRVSIL